MTDPKALAEKICGITIGSDYAEIRPGILKAVESLLAEAINTAVIEKMMDEDPDFQGEAETIMNAAYDRAAEVADPPCPTPAECTHMHYERLAERIRELKGGL